MEALEQIPQIWIIIITIVSSLGGYKILDAITNAWRARKQEGRDDDEFLSSNFKELLAMYKAERDEKQSLIDRQSNAIQVLTLQVRELEDHVRDLKTTLSTMEALHLDLPLPQWVKDKKGRVISMNKAFEDIFLLPIGKTLEDYIGYTDTEVWGEEIGSEYAENDLEVLRKRRAIHNVETVLTKSGKKKYWYTFKYPIWQNRSIIGVGGIAYKAVDEMPDSVPEGFNYKND